MKTLVRKVLFAGVSLALLATSAVTFAQGGGNGQGGTGGGNSHGAATAGMTHWGDPVSGPNAINSINMPQPMRTNESSSTSTSMQPGNAQSEMKSPQ
jgi:hypothetical protein